MTRTVHPGHALAHKLDAVGVTPTELARQIRVPANRITQIINGQRGITGDSALRLVLGFADERQIFVATLRGAHPLRYFPRLYLLYNADGTNPDKAVIDGACVNFSEEVEKRSPLEAFEVRLFPVHGSDKHAK